MTENDVTSQSNLTECRLSLESRHSGKDQQLSEADRLKQAYADALAARESTGRPPAPFVSDVAAPAPALGRIVPMPPLRRPRWPDIGTTKRVKGQIYRCVGVEPYYTRFHAEIGLLLLESRCPDCGIRFGCKSTKTNMRQGYVRRRCDRCKAPGRAVRPSRKARRRQPRQTFRNPRNQFALGKQQAG